MTLFVQLPVALEQKLAAYCATHHLTENEAIQQALKSLLAQDSPVPTPYELGRDGFGADRVHSGDIARESKQLLPGLARKASPFRAGM